MVDDFDNMYLPILNQVSFWSNFSELFHRKLVMLILCTSWKVAHLASNFKLAYKSATFELKRVQKSAFYDSTHHFSSKFFNKAGFLSKGEENVRNFCNTIFCSAKILKSAQFQNQIDSI